MGRDYFSVSELAHLIEAYATLAAMAGSLRHGDGAELP